MSGPRTGGSRDDAGRQRGAARSTGRARPRTARAPRERRRAGDPARTVAFEVLREVDGSDAYANLVLPPALRAHGLQGRDAAFATELTYGTLRMRGLYDAVIALAASRAVERIDPPVLDLLRLGAHQVLGMRVPAHAAVSETVALARQVAGVGASQFVNAVLRAVAATPREAWSDRLDAERPDALERAAVRHSHPTWVVRALRQALAADGYDPDEAGTGLVDLLRADNTAPAVTLVARPGLADRDQVLAEAAGAPGRWTPTAVVLDGGDPADLASVAAGRAGVQDEGSQLVALALAGAPLHGEDGGRWLDLCAGPGGKAALLGALAAQVGASVVANEVQPHRVGLVRRSVQALPDGVVRTRQGDGREVGAAEPGAYDRVLVDAPCTGLGALRRRPESRWRRNPTDVGPLSGLQRELLGSALEAVRPGGVVAYVTCSPHLAETALVVKDVLRAHREVEVLDAREVVRAVAGPLIPLGPGPWVQLWPHVHGTDAMFLALLRRPVAD